ncbi:MAG: AtpZ/AtpI family protein [Anaerolineae bacterium]
MHNFAVGYGLVLKFSSILVCSVLGSLFAGIYLDRWLGTKPWLMLILMVAGIAFGTYTVYQVATRDLKKL